MEELKSRHGSTAVLRFGDFRLDQSRAELTRAGQPIGLRPKTFSLLTQFIASPGRVLAKDELLAALWPRTVVTEASLTQCVAELRAALGCVGDVLIKTVPRQGYRFDAEVIQEAKAPTSRPQEKPSIAVLPFQILGSDAKEEYFGDGVVEEITTALSRIRSLLVIARNSSFAYKNKAVDVKQVGQELGVRYVLEGSVRKSANQIRITGQLVDAVTGIYLWADRFDGGLEDIFALQDHITASVVGAILPNLERAEIERARHKPTENLDAYDYYLRGLASFRQFSNQGTMDEALRLFLRAIELDPEFAFAHTMAACCYGARKATGSMTDFAADVPETERLVKRAAALGADDPFTLAGSGWAVAYVAGDLDTGFALIDRALALNPNVADGWLWGGWIKVWLGEPDEAIAWIERAMRLSPLNPYLWIAQVAAAHACFFAGRHDESSSYGATALRSAPEHPAGLRIHAASSAFAGQLEQARRSVAGLLQRNPTLRVSGLGAVLGPYRRAEDVGKYQEGLRRAGLPE